MEYNTLRKAQLIQLEIAKEVMRICKENNITCFLDSGTLLGAVRHKGFIPWDDDLDLGMQRGDYEKFLKIAPEKLDTKYELIQWKTEAEYPHPFSKVMKKNTLYIEEAQGGNSKCGIYVDVFPYDNFPEEKKFQRKQGRKITAYRAMLRAKCHYRTWVVHNKFNLKKWFRNLPFRWMSLFYSKEQLVMKYESISQKYNDKLCTKLFTQGVSKYGTWVVPKKCFREYVDLKFEDTEFCCPVGYDNYLKCVYGDYMKLPPVSERENRHSIIKIDFGE